MSAKTQRVTCQVRLGGSMNDVVTKVQTPYPNGDGAATMVAGISIAEVEVLRALHGSDAVINIAQVEKPRQLSDNQERGYLTDTYGDKVIGDLFPGLRPNFPHTVEELSTVAGSEEPEPVDAEPVREVPPSDAPLPGEEVKEDDEPEEDLSGPVPGYVPQPEGEARPQRSTRANRAGV